MRQRTGILIWGESQDVHRLCLEMNLKPPAPLSVQVLNTC